MRWVLPWLLLSACFTPVGEPCRGPQCAGANDGGAECRVGSFQACGSAVGTCQQGKQSCGADGQWSTCVGGVLPSAEVCDGRDNNCDGQVDEGVAQACPLKLGVCAGAQSTCGASPGCDYGPHYEAVETSCDGLDNDCDGRVDNGGLLNVSASPGVVSRHAVAAMAPGGSGGALVLWEEGPKVAVRLVRADGTLTPAVAPSVTVEAVSRAWAPAIAADGPLAVAAWAEQVGAISRVMIATLDPASGRSTLTNGAALYAMSVSSVTEVAVAVDAAANRVLLAAVDNGALRLVSFTATLSSPNALFKLEPLDATGQAPTVSKAGSGAFWLGYDRRSLGKVQRAFVELDGGARAEPTQPNGQSVTLFGDGTNAQSYFLSGLSQAARTVQTSRCDRGVACGPVSPLFEGSGFARADIDGLVMAGPAGASAPTVAVWQEGLGSPLVAFALVGTPNPSVQVVSAGRRPAAVVSAQHHWFFFDTEAVPSAAVRPDEVYLQRSCR